MTTVVNLYGGPGTGKSTVASGVHSILKLHGVRSEYISEYAKDLTWEESRHTLENQIHLFGEQYRRMWRVMDKVDVIVTDSPLLLCSVYDGGRCEKLNDLVHDTYNKMDNVDVILQRTKEYDPIGRNQSEDEAKAIDGEIISLLLIRGISCLRSFGNEIGINYISNFILRKLKKEQNIMLCRGNINASP